MNRRNRIETAPTIETWPTRTNPFPKDSSKRPRIVTLLIKMIRIVSKTKPQRFCLLLFIPICLLINALSGSIFSGFYWETYYTDARFRPRMIQLDKATNNLVDVSRLILKYNLINFKHRQNTQMYWDNNGRIKQWKEPDNMMTRETCIYLGDWQFAYNPTCNNIHQVDLKSDHVKIINNGAYRDVWKIPETSLWEDPLHEDGFRVLKTLRLIEKRDFDLRNFDRHRRDAVAFSQLQKSPHVMDIYGHCGNSALFDYSEGGTLLELFDKTNRRNHRQKKKLSQLQLLEIAHSVAESVADLHHSDRQGRPTIAHTDIKPDQWLLGRNGKYQLGDFNRARFLTWDTEREESCPFQIEKNVGIWRSPEEYNYGNQTEKVDIWSLGNVLYFLLSEGLLPMYQMTSENAIKYVQKGGHPIHDAYLKLSHDLFTDIMGNAMMSCFELNPAKRPNARKVTMMLNQGLQKLKKKYLKKA
jgi:hypothetical protein